MVVHGLLCPAGVFVVAGDPCSGPHAYIARISSTELASQL